MWNEIQERAVDYVKKLESISIPEYISLNDVSDRTARRDLNKLVEVGIFVKEGLTTGLKFKLRSTPVKRGVSKRGINDAIL